MPIIFTIIESPYGKNVDGTPADAATIERNLTYVRAAMADCFARGETPFASHALYTQPGVLDDRIPEERKKGMDAGFLIRKALGAHDDAGWTVIVQTACYEDYGVTPGMAAGLNRSIDDRVPVVFRRILPRVNGCPVPPPGWSCTREPGHEGPCAAVPTVQGITP